MSGESKGGEGGESPDGGGGSSGSSILLRSSIHGSVSVQPFIRIGCCRFHARSLISIDLNVSCGYRIRIIVGRNGMSWFLRDSSCLPVILPQISSRNGLITVVVVNTVTRGESVIAWWNNDEI